LFGNLDGSKYSDIKCTNATGKTYFSLTLLNEKVLKFCANKYFISVYTDQNYLHVYNLYGMSLSEPYFLPFVCFLECSPLQTSLLAIQVSGELFLWNVSKQQQIAKLNILSLFGTKNKGDFISKAFVDENSNILLNTDTGKVFLYDPNIGVFKKVKDMLTYSIRSGLNFGEIKPQNELSKFLFGIPDALQNENQQKIDQIHQFQAETTVLEEKLQTAKFMKLPEYWLLFKKYILLLVESKNSEKLRALVNELISLKNGQIMECNMIKLSEEEFKMQPIKIMGKTPDEILKNDILKMAEDSKDPNVISIIDSIRLLK